MTIASGVNAGLRYIAETTQGTTPTTPTLKKLRATGRNINLNKNILESQVVETHRMRTDVRHGFNSVVGDPGFEYSLSNQDDFLAAVLGHSQTWVDESSDQDSVTVTIVAGATASITLGSGTWDLTKYYGGLSVTLSGLSNAGSNGTYYVTSVSSTVMTVADPGGDIASVTGDSLTIEIAGDTIKCGTTLTTFSIERAFTDIAQFQLFRGCSIDQMSLSVSPEAIVGGNFNVLGMSAAPLAGTTASTGGTPTEPTARQPFSAFDGALYENGTLIAVVTSLDLSIANNNRLEGVVGSKTSPAVFHGQLRITGTLTAFFENATYLNKFINETSSELWMRFFDIGGTNYHNWVLHNVKYNGGTIDPPTDGPVPLVMPFEALYDSSTTNALTIQRSVA